MNETNERQNGPDGHCAPAGDEREDAVEGIKHIRELVGEVMANLAAKAGRSDPPQREKGDS